MSTLLFLSLLWFHYPAYHRCLEFCPLNFANHLCWLLDEICSESVFRTPQNGTPKAGGPCRCDRCWRRICDQMRSWGGTEKWPRCVSWGGNVVQHWQKEQKQPGVWREAKSYSWMFVRLLLCPEGVVPGPVSVNVRSVHHGPWNHARPPTALQGLLWVNGMSRAYWEFHPD